MATKPKTRSAPTPATFPRKAVSYTVEQGATEEEIARCYAAMATSPELASYRVIGASEAKTVIGKDLDVPALLEHLRAQAGAVNRNDLSQAEAMLMNQATALQSLFARLAERGMGCNDAVPFEINMRMALRAQAQCRATLETLANIKNPPAVFARQANVTTGPQQINNGMGAPSRPREDEFPPSKLLEAGDGERMDTGTASAAGRANQELEAVGAIHGAANSQGEGPG